MRHVRAFRYVVATLLPIIFRTGKRPVLFLKESGIGDIICTFPAALELRKRHPGSECIYKSHRDYTCLAKLGGVAEHAASGQEIDVVSYWYRFLLAGSYLFYSDDDLTDGRHAEIYIKDFGRNFGVSVSGDHPFLRADEKSAMKVDAFLCKNRLDTGRLVIIHPGPTWPVREWTPEHWTALVEKLRVQGFTNIVQPGIGMTQRFGETEVAVIPGAYSLVNQWSLAETVALIARASLHVGIDSGLLHIAAALRIPAVGIWGPTSPHLRFAPTSSHTPVVSTVPCQGCHHRLPRLHWFSNCPYDIVCMKTISPEEVLHACLQQIRVTP